MTLHTEKPFAERLLSICSLCLAVSPAHSYWINYVPGNFEWYAENTRSGTPEGAAQRRCEIQYNGTKPLDTLWHIETRDGRPIYGFTCGNLYTIPSFNGIVWHSCDLPGQAYSPAAASCVPVEELCGEGGFTHELGRCLNRNLGASSCPTTPYVGNPINAATGNKFQLETDIDPGGPSHLRFVRFYNSLQRPSDDSLFDGRWRSNFDASIKMRQAWGMYRVVLYRPDGETLQYELLKDGWVGAKNAGLTLEHSVDGNGDISRWTLTHANGEKEEYDSKGRLVALHDTQARKTTMTYDDASKLTTVSDPDNRSLHFIYDETGRLTQVTGPAGQEYTYAYDAAGNLAEVRYPDSTPVDDSDNPRRVYRYQDPRFPTHLTGIVDERGSTLATWAYDERGRAVSGEHAAGTYAHSLTFHGDGTTSVVDPLGRKRTYQFSDQFGRKEIASIAGGSCIDCGGNATGFTYDTNGYVASQTDHRGNIVTYERDRLGRELRRTEAVGTHAERTISTTWHPVLGKPLTVTEPGRQTIFTYDAQGRMVSSSVQSQP